MCLAATDPGASGEPYLCDLSDLGGRGSRRARGFHGGYNDFGVRPSQFVAIKARFC